MRKGLSIDIVSTLPAASGPTGELTVGYDWAETHLGPIETWTSIVRASVLLTMRSPLAITTLWGSDGMVIYNDGYAAFAGSRHPDLLGRKVLEAWPEAADLNRHVLDTCLAGRTLSYKDQELTLYRHGEPDEVWVDLDYSPILDET